MVLKHPNFDQDYLNDIMLIILSQRIEYTKNIKPACLPKLDGGNFPSAEDDVFAVGWVKKIFFFVLF